MQGQTMVPGGGPDLIDDTIVELADANREHDLAALIAERARIDASMVAKALSSDRVETTAAVCRIAGLPLNSYSAILRMRARNKPSQSRALPILLEAYRQTAAASPSELAASLRSAGCYET